MWSPILASVAYAIRCSHHSTLNATLGQLVFGRDMLLNLKFKPNYKKLWAKKKSVFNTITSGRTPRELPMITRLTNMSTSYKMDNITSLKETSKAPSKSRRCFQMAPYGSKREL